MNPLLERLIEPRPPLPAPVPGRRSSYRLGEGWVCPERRFRAVCAEIVRLGIQWQLTVSREEAEALTRATGWGYTAVRQVLRDLRLGRPLPCPTREERLEAELAAARQEIARLRRALETKGGV